MTLRAVLLALAVSAAGWLVDAPVHAAPPGKARAGTTASLAAP